MQLTTIRQQSRKASEVLGSIGLSALLLLSGAGPSPAAEAAAGPLSVDPVPQGDFSWKGQTWERRSWNGAPQFNKSFDPANVSGPDSNGFITMSITNPSGSAPAGAEFQSTRQGFGYGTYSTTVAKDVSSLQKEVVWGCLFTYDAEAGPGYNEIDLCEASAWGGGAAYGQSWPVSQGHGYWFDAGKLPGEGNSTVDFPVTANPVLTHRMIWAPRKLTFETYAGEGYSGALLKRTVLEGPTVPVPARERIHFNLWVVGSGGGDPAHVKPETVTIRDFSFTSAASATTELYGAPAPVPAIAGAPNVGATLTASTGTGSSGPGTVYRWYRAGPPIPGATGPTYALTAVDLGKALGVSVTGSKADGQLVSRHSAPTAPIRPGTLAASAPSVTGTVKVGSALGVRPGIWTTGTGFKYQWYRAGVPITGAVAATYRLIAADAGKKMSIRITGNKPGYQPAAKTSAVTAPVVAGTLKAPVPTVSGILRAGHVLTANPGAWTSGATLRFQWYRSGVVIPGATGRTYRVVAADRADALKVRVSGSLSGYTPATRFSAPTTLVR